MTIFVYCFCFGTEEDKAKLGNNQQNRTRVQCRPHKKPLADKRRVRRRRVIPVVVPVAPAAEENEIAEVDALNEENGQGNEEENLPAPNNTPNDGGLPDFTNELSERAQERGRQIAEAVRNEDRAAL